MIRFIYGLGLFLSSTILSLMLVVACLTDLPEQAANDLKAQGVESAFVEFNTTKPTTGKCKGYRQSVADIKDWKKASKAGLTTLGQRDYIKRLEESRKAYAKRE